jgi:hypothetical protein
VDAEKKMDKSDLNSILLLCCDNKNKLTSGSGDLFVFALSGKHFFLAASKESKSLLFYLPWCVLLCDKVYGPDMCNIVLILL